MFCVYIIQNNKTKQIYIGKSNNLFRRIKEHNSGKSKFTNKKNGKWILIYSEFYRDKKDADDRELALKKHGSGKRWLKTKNQK